MVGSFSIAARLHSSWSIRWTWRYFAVLRSRLLVMCACTGGCAWCQLAWAGVLARGGSLAARPSSAPGGVGSFLPWHGHSLPLPMRRRVRSHRDGALMLVGQWVALLLVRRLAEAPPIFLSVRTWLLPPESGVRSQGGGRLESGCSKFSMDGNPALRINSKRSSIWK